MRENISFDQFVSRYAHAKTYQAERIEIFCPWGVVCNLDGHSIQDFSLLVDLADRKGWEIIVGEVSGL